MTEQLFSLLALIISSVFGAGGVLFFYKANKRKAEAEADALEIKNLSDYQKLVFEQTTEIVTLNEKIIKLESTITKLDDTVVRLEENLKGICVECKYKKAYKN